MASWLTFWCLALYPRAKRFCDPAPRPGDGIYVTGELGASASALKLLSGGKKLKPDDFPRHFYPTPRVEVGRYLRERGLASAMVDISDGLSTDLGHICEESEVGAEIEAGTIPVALIGRSGRKVDMRFALHGGEDYELLFTVPQTKTSPIPDRGGWDYPDRESCSWTENRLEGARRRDAQVVAAGLGALPVREPIQDL